MHDTVHYVSGGAAAGSLRAVCEGRSTDCVVEIVDSLSIGPLYGIDQTDGLAARRRYLRRLFESIGEKELYESLDPRVGLPELRAAVPEAARTIVWCGPNADEQLLLRAVCARGSDHPLYVVAIGVNGTGTEVHRAVGACSPDELRIAERGVRLLSAAARRTLAGDWARLLRSDCKLRLFIAGHIADEDEGAFDRLLVAACPQEFASAARVVGQVMRESAHLVPDSFLDFRLRELIARGEIEANNARERLASLRIRNLCARLAIYGAAPT